MRWVFLVAGLAVGYALGMLNAGPSRTSRHASPPASFETPGSTDARNPAATTAASRPGGTASTETEPPPDHIVEPNVEPDGTGCPVDEGQLEVDFGTISSSTMVWVAYTSMRGTREEQYFTADPPETVAVYEGTPGIYEVWWLDGPRRVGTRVRLVAGRIVRLRASDFDTAYIDQRIAVLAIRVHATWGTPLRYAGVNVTSGSDGERVRTDARGCANVTLRPGQYVIEVGDSKTPAVVEAGQQTVVEIQPGGEGDLLFSPCAWVVTDRVYLRRTDGVATQPVSLLGGTNGPRMGFAFLAAAEYEIIRKFSRGTAGGTVLGTTRVLSGKTNRFPLTLPPGKLTVEVEFARARASNANTVLVSLQRVSDGVTGALRGHARAQRITTDGLRYRAVLDGLHPGSYRVSCGSWRTAKIVEIGARRAAVTLKVPMAIR